MVISARGESIRPVLKTVPLEEFAFEEDTEGADHNKYTWSNAAYAMGVNITKAFKLYGWCARIRGAESGGMVAIWIENSPVIELCPVPHDVLAQKYAYVPFVFTVHVLSTTSPGVKITGGMTTAPFGSSSSNPIRLWPNQPIARRSPGSPSGSAKFTPGRT